MSNPSNPFSPAAVPARTIWPRELAASLECT